MTGSYLGLVSAFLAETSTRLMLPYWARHFSASAMTAFWTIVGITSGAVLASGVWLQRRNRGIVATYRTMVERPEL